MDRGAGCVRACIVDDHPLVRHGLCLLLMESDGYEVVGTAGDVASGRALLLAQRPHVAIVDARLPDGSGLVMLREVRQSAPEVLCLVMTAYPSVESFREVVRAGASGYVTKDVSFGTLLAALRLVARDEPTARHDAGVSAPQSSPSSLPIAGEPVEVLTPRERRILDLVARGWRAREIAADLLMPEKAVRNHVSTLLGRLGVGDRSRTGTLTAGAAGADVWAVAGL